MDCLLIPIFNHPILCKNVWWNIPLYKIGYVAVMADVILSSIFDKGSQYSVPYTMVLSFFTGLCFNCQLRGEENYYRLSHIFYVSNYWVRLLSQMIWLDSYHLYTIFDSILLFLFLNTSWMKMLKELCTLQVWKRGN